MLNSFFFSLLIPFASRNHNDLPQKMIKSSTATIQKLNEPVTFEKPTILDIISETERNQTKMQSARNQPASAPAQQINADTSKSIGHVDLASGHPGIAEPLTWQQLEHEMSVVDQKVKDSSTSKDGISTWILLSGSDQAESSSATPPAATTVIGTVDRIEVKSAPNDRTNFRFEELQQAKLNKLTKLREAIERRRGRPEKKNIQKQSVVTPIPEETLQSTDVVTETKIVQRRKNPSVQKANKRKAATTSTSTTTTTTEKPEDETTIVQYIHDNLDFITTTTTTPFIVMEPKDADFDLPQDRSPGTTKKPKRAGNNKNKRKNSANKQKKPATKAPLVKPSDKPIVSKIYSYLAREVMPTVGVGLMGLVVTAGLASYLFGPLGALRRSYDDALDRQDNADNIYAVNSEEYASDSSDSGQNEEELFGKFIAGMPANYMPKYVKYGPQQHQRPGEIQYYPNPNPAQRRVQGQPAMGPQSKYHPHYMRNRPDMTNYPKISPNQYNTVQYHQPHQVLRNHQPQPQQPLATSYNPHYHDIQQQKSLTNNMESILKLNKAEAFVAEPNTNYNTIIQEKSVGTSIMAEAPETPAEDIAVDVKMSEDNDNERDENKMQRRTSQFVVGSVLPDTKPNEAIVSASMKTAEILPSNAQSASHGPRRRRKRAINSKSIPAAKKSVSQNREIKQITKSDADQPATAAVSIYSTKIYNQTEIQQLDELFNKIKAKLDSFTKNQTNEQIKNKNTEKIQKEFNELEKDLKLLRQVVADIRDIEEFQKEFHIRAKNFELSMTIKTGIIHIRQRMRLISDLIDHPDDERIVQKINRRDGSNGDVSLSGMETTTNDPAAALSIDKVNSFGGLLRLLQLKAAFGLHILQNIRPSFEKAFEEVFKMPVKGNLNI